MSSGSEHDTLRKLEELERALSAERRRLHDRIDHVRAGGGGADAGVEADRLRHLEERERELSARRRELHRQIDEARGTS